MVQVQIGLTVGRDEGFILGDEALVHVGRVRHERDGHLVALTGDHRALRLPAAQSATQRRVSRQVVESVSGRLSRTKRYFNLRLLHLLT